MARKPKVEVMPRLPAGIPGASTQLATALNMAITYNVRAALGQQFNPKLLDDAAMVLAGALNNYAEALRDEILEGKIRP